MSLEVLVADTDGMNVSNAYARLEQAGAKIRILESKDPSTIAKAGATAEVLLVSSAAVPAQVLESMPCLQLVSCMSTGIDHVDVAAAKRLGIHVAHLSDASTDSVAAHTLALTLAAVRELPRCIEVAESGDWSIRADVRPLQPSQLVLGVVGLGRIGLRFAEMASTIFGRVVGFDAAPPAAGDPFERLAAAQLAKLADVVSLHLPSTPGTRRVVQGEVLPNLRPGSILINTSRGDLVPRQQLLKLLNSGVLRSAALDVLPEEPPSVDDPLLLHPRTIVTPHYAFLSEATAASYPEKQVDAVIEYFALDRQPT